MVLNVVCTATYTQVLSGDVVPLYERNVISRKRNYLLYAVTLGLLFIRNTEIVQFFILLCLTL